MAASCSTEEFLTLVAEREALWKKSHREFANKDIRAKTLNELSELSGMTGENTRKDIGIIVVDAFKSLKSLVIVAG